MGKPIHPATVHWPLSFLILGYGLDIVHHNRSSLPTFISNMLLTPNDMTRASYYLLSLGLLSSIPALVTGGGELVKMIKKQGMHDAEGNVRTKVKATIAHAIANDIVIFASTYIWYTRRSQVKNSIAGRVPGTESAVYAPSKGIVFAEFVITAILLFAANIGGVLTYNYGVGFTSLSAGKEVNLRVGTYADDDKQRIKKAHAAFNRNVPNANALVGEGTPVTK